MSGNTKENCNSIPSWFWWTLFWIPLGFLSWWFLRWFFLPSYKRTSSVEIKAPRSSGMALPVQNDDFKKLKGIGPKTAEALYQARIYSFEQLALMQKEDLKRKLKEMNLPTRGVEFWQDQAALAAAEDWDALAELQK